MEKMWQAYAHINQELFTKEAVSRSMLLRWITVLVFAFSMTLCPIMGHAPAQASTNLVLNEDLSGTRTMYLELDTYAQENYLMVGLSDLNQAIEDACPDELDYQGFKSDDETIYFTFVLSFSSLDDYNDKLATLTEDYLDEVAQATFVEYDSVLKSGYYFSENFTDEDLFLWLKDELEGDEIALGSFSSFYDYGMVNLVEYKGEEYESWGALSIDESENNGFYSVSMETTLDEEGLWTREITFSISDSNLSLYQAYFNDNTPDGVEVNYGDSIWYTTWVATIGPTDALKIQEATAILLQDENAIFKVEEESEGARTLALQMEVTDQASCAAVCRSSEQEIGSLVVVPEDYVKIVDNLSGATYSEVNNSDTTSYQKYIPVENVEAVTSYSSSDVPTIEINYEFSAQTGTSYRDILESVLIPELNGLSGEIIEGDVWSVDVTIAGDSMDEVTETLSTYLPGSSIELNEESGFFTKLQDITQVWDFTEIMISDQLSGEIIYSWNNVDDLTMDEYTSIRNGQYTDTSFSTVTIQYTHSRMPIITMIVIGVFVVLIMAVLIIFRKKISDLWSKLVSVFSAPPVPAGYERSSVAYRTSSNYEGDSAYRRSGGGDDGVDYENTEGSAVQASNNVDGAVWVSSDFGLNSTDIK